MDEVNWKTVMLVSLMVFLTVIVLGEVYIWAVGL